MERMPEKEQLIMRLWRASGTTGHPDPAEELRLCDEILAPFPDDKYVVMLASALAVEARRLRARLAGR